MRTHIVPGGWEEKLDCSILDSLIQGSGVYGLNTFEQDKGLNMGLWIGFWGHFLSREVHGQWSILTI